MAFDAAMTIFEASKNFPKALATIGQKNEMITIG